MNDLLLDKFTNLKQFTILYAEDEPATQTTLASMLEDYFGHVVAAKDGLEAWEIFQTRHFDIVLTDILMPHLDGIELMRNIRHVAQKDIPIVLISALTDTHYFLDAIKLKCNGYVLKPLKFEELLETLHEAILPFTQHKTIEMKNRLLVVLNILFGGKKVEIVEYLFEHCNDEQIFYGTHDEIAEHLHTTRQTVAQCFKDLAKFGLLEKMRNKTYKLNHANTLWQQTPLFKTDDGE